jgi:6-phosphogluconolactonase
VTSASNAIYPGSLHVFRDAAQVANAAAELFVATASKAIRERGVFRVALSGGSTPRKTYELLGGKDFSGRVDWDQVHIFWGDERFVPSDHPDSNYRMTAEAMLSHVPVPPSQVHRFETERESAEAAATAYEETIRKEFGNSLPQFDLIYLGLGTNGHTASLFPGSPALKEQSRLVIADFVAEVKSWRLSMSAPLINRGRVVAFLVAGAEKATVLHDVLLGPREPDHLPAQLIAPPGELQWLVDEAAAALVSRNSGNFRSERK